MNPDNWTDKTIERIETDNDSYVVIHFTDGTSLEFAAHGSEEAWLTFREND